LKVTKTVEGGESKAILYHECRIREGIIYGWMKEAKSHSFLDSVEEKVRLQRKKTRLCESTAVDVDEVPRKNWFRSKWGNFESTFN
jgi:hypothetical protein